MYRLLRFWIMAFGGTGPFLVSDWDEESAMQIIQGNGTDGYDEDPVGNLCTNGFDDDHDGLVDSADPDFDGDADCATNDDDGDGLVDEDVDGWDTLMAMEWMMAGR